MPYGDLRRCAAAISRETDWVDSEVILAQDRIDRTMPELWHGFSPAHLRMWDTFARCMYAPARQPALIELPTSETKRWHITLAASASRLHAAGKATRRNLACTIPKIGMGRIVLKLPEPSFLLS
jgi:hypothetical protein